MGIAFLFGTLFDNMRAHLGGPITFDTSLRRSVQETTQAGHRFIAAQAAKARQKKAVKKAKTAPLARTPTNAQSVKRKPTLLASLDEGGIARPSLLGQ